MSSICFCYFRYHPYQKIECASCIKCSVKRQQLKENETLRRQLMDLISLVNININVDMGKATTYMDYINFILETNKKSESDMDYQILMEYLQVKERYLDQKIKFCKLSE